MALSVHRRVVRVARKVAEQARLTGEYDLPEVLRGGRQGILRERIDQNQAPCRQLGVELAGRPARVAGEQPDRIDSRKLLGAAMQVDDAELASVR